MRQVWHQLWPGMFGVLLFMAGQAWANPLAAQDTGKAVVGKLNQIDQDGRQGLWYIDEKETRGEAGYIAFGQYLNNKKQGLWYRMDHLGRLVFIRNYSNGVLDGVSQFYQQGHLVCIGHYRGLNPKYALDSFWVVNPLTGEDTLITVASEKRTVKHGLWRYYDAATGQLTAEEKYQVGYLLYRKEFEQPAPDPSLHKQRPGYRPIDKEKAAQKIPDRAKRKIGY